MTPLVSLEAILDDRGQRFGRSVSVLPALPPYAKESTVCGDYGCSYHHDFKHNEKGSVLITEDALADCQAKMLHKWKSFEQLVGQQEEVLFVHLGSFKTPPVAWPYLAETEPLPVSRVNALQAKLAALFPRTRCRLLQVHYPDFTPLTRDEPEGEHVAIGTLAFRPGLNWQGDEAAWGEILAPYQRFGRKA